jgi:hypothetical protein
VVDLAIAGCRFQIVQPDLFDIKVTNLIKRSAIFPKKIGLPAVRITSESSDVVGLERHCGLSVST